MNPAKTILLGTVRKLRSKAAAKRREADRLEDQANKLEEQSKSL